MCIKIITSDSEKEFNPSLPLDCQIVNSDRIVIEYDRKSTEIQYFVDELVHQISLGLGAQVQFEVVGERSLMQAQLSKRLKEMEKDLQINSLIRIMSRIYSDTDKKLCQISDIISKQG